VVGFLRPGAAGSSVLVLANVGDHAVHIAPLTLSGLVPDAVDLVEGVKVSLRPGRTLPAHGVAWLRVALS
jgi:amylosucrase